MAKPKLPANPPPQSTPGAPANTIPGLGPIRARALAKAGWSNTAELKRASLSDLMAVPGISENKARQIIAYVNGDTPAPPPAVVDAPPPTALPVHGDPLQTVAVEVATAAAALLRSEKAGRFSRRLARQLSKAASVAETIASGAVVQTTKAERAALQLQKMGSALIEASGRNRLGTRQQERLSDELRGRRRKLKQRLQRTRQIHTSSI